MKSNRISLWDNVRFLLIFSVVLGHLVADYIEDYGTFASLFFFIYSFHMPLFLFVSGLFHKNKNIPEKVISYLSIYMLLKIATYWIRLAYGIRSVIPVFSESSFAWFMFALAVYVLVTYLFRNINLKYLFLFALVIGCFCNYDKDLGDFLCMSRILVFYPYYLLGVLVDRHRIEDMCRNQKLRIGALGIILVWALICLVFREQMTPLRPLLTARNHFNPEVWDFGAFYRLFLYLVAAVVGMSFILITPSQSLGCITVWGRRTLQIYFWHRLILLVLSYAKIDDWLTSHGPIGKLTWLAFGIVLTAFCALPIFRQPTDWILKAPFKKE